MIIRTSVGEVSTRQMLNDPDSVWVVGGPEALQSLRDGIEMSVGGSVTVTTEGGMIVTKEQLAVWIQFEILNYLTYTEFLDGDTQA